MKTLAITFDEILWSIGARCIARPLPADCVIDAIEVDNAGATMKVMISSRYFMKYLGHMIFFKFSEALVNGALWHDGIVQEEPDFFRRRRGIGVYLNFESAWELAPLLAPILLRRKQDQSINYIHRCYVNEPESKLVIVYED